ncbi:MAG: serine/threonine protein kinase [Verrucomicrobia bacterium]|nr:serine/threonine protein kinase [Verrucomicrobiota bacterium]
MSSHAANNPDNQTSRCDSCGAPLEGDVHEGVCPKCALMIAINDLDGGSGDDVTVAEDTIAHDYSEKSASRHPTEAVPNKNRANLKTPESPRQLGPYRIIKAIGEGGMGQVYLADQQEPVKRQVAVKIVRPGMGSEEIIARFEAERQALAVMDHPNIARVFDAGTEEGSGLPYFVMELVKGKSITEYCDEEKLTTRERLELFIQLCRAVQHAHQKGVVHRDLKPNNILVEKRDGKPFPKIIDFGIAKAVGQGLTEETLLTQAGQLVGTPQYMSPEQAEFGATDIDTRSDIYALGVLLYELLTGDPPLKIGDLRKAGLDEILRIVREEEPSLPSKALEGMASGSLTTLAEKRGTETSRLTALTRGDLDLITLKALEKERERRYETATALAEDVRRFLRNEPIQARPPTLGYRLQKYAKRNKLQLAAAAVIFITLIIGIVVSSWQAVSAMNARDAELEQRTLAEEATLKAIKSEGEARSAAAKAQASEKVAQEAKSQSEAKRNEAALSARETKAVLIFFAKILAAARPKEQAGGLGVDITIREAIDAVRPQIVDASPGQPLIEASVRHALGETYNYLSDYEAAILQYEIAFNLREKSFGEENRDTLMSMSHLASTYGNAGRLDEALALHEKALKIKKRELGPKHISTLNSMSMVGYTYRLLGRYKEALSLNEETLKLKRRVLGHEDPNMLHAMGAMANSYTDSGRHKEALVLREETLRLRKKVQGIKHPETLHDMGNMAISFWNVGRQGEALALEEEALQLKTEVLGANHSNTIDSMESLASIYGKMGRHEDALALKKEIQIKRKALDLKNNLDIMVAVIPSKLAVPVPRDSRLNSSLEAVLFDFSSLPDSDHIVYDMKDKIKSLTLPVPHDSLFSQDIGYQADKSFQDFAFKAKTGFGHETLDAMRDEAHSLYKKGSYEEALILWEETLKLLKVVFGEEHEDTLDTMYYIALSYEKVGRNDEATALRKEAKQIFLGER